MIKALLLSLLLIVALSLPASAEISLAPETEIQFMRLYEGEFQGQGFEIERSAQTHLLGADIKLGKFQLNPKIGIQTSQMEVAEIADVENELGLALGANLEYSLLSFHKFSLALMGSYLYARSEIDEVKVGNISIDNPFRNELSCHSYELGGKVAASLPHGFKPYVGLVYADSTLNLTTDNLPVDIEVEAETAKNLGLRAGLEFSPSKNVVLKLAGKFLDQTSLVGSCKYKF